MEQFPLGLRKAWLSFCITNRERGRDTKTQGGDGWDLILLLAWVGTVSFARSTIAPDDLEKFVPKLIPHLSLPTGKEPGLGQAYNQRR